MAWLVAIKGNGVDPDIAISLEYSFPHNAFMVLNPEDYLWASKDSEGFGTILRRDQVIGTPLASMVFRILDEIWVSDPYVKGYVENQ